MWPSHDSGRQDPVRRIGQDLTAAFSAAPESAQQIQGSTVLEIGDSPDFALSLSLSGFLVTFEARGGAAQSTTRTPSTPYGTGKRECAPRDRGEGQHASRRFLPSRCTRSRCDGGGSPD